MRLLTIVMTVAYAAGCVGSAPVVEPPPPSGSEAHAGPAFTAIVLEGGSIVTRDLRTGSRSGMRSLPGAVEALFEAPSGKATVASIAAPDSVRLVRVDPGTGRSLVVDTRPRPVVYTVAWAPSGDSFAFGHFRPTIRDARPAMGAGGILVVDSAGTRTVGCSASRAVLAWLPGGRLLVRNSDNLYVVDRSDCTTRSTVDARRMHQLTASPDGVHIAYVHRELVYDRLSGQYVADSTFMLADIDGSNERAVVSFRYRPTRFAWRPDGSELAYDVQNPDRTEQRLISILDLVSGRSSYLHPPSADGPSEYDAYWSPDGSRILYRQDSMLVVRTFADPYAVVLEGSDGADPIGWAGPDAVVARLSDHAFRLYPLHGGATYDFDAVADVLVVAPQ